MFCIGWKTENHFQTVKKLNKKPLKNSTFQLISHHFEMFEKHFLIVVVLPGLIMFTWDGISDHTSWNEVFLYWDTKPGTCGGDPLIN